MSAALSYAIKYVANMDAAVRFHREHLTLRSIQPCSPSACIPSLRCALLAAAELDRQVRDNESQDVRGMTVNERLVHFGLVAAFDAAVKSKDRGSVMRVLEQAQFTAAQAEQKATAVLLHPERYGFSTSR